MIERWAELDFNYKMGDSGAYVEIRDLLWRHREALRRVVEAAQRIAKYPAGRGDELSAETMRQLAGEALGELEKKA